MNHAWLKGPAFDLSMAFGWVPFAIFIWLTPLAGADAIKPGTAEWRYWFDIAFVLALSVNFIHRHFVYFLIFGDSDQMRRHPRAIWIAPVIAVVVTAIARFAGVWAAFGFALATWNIWHVITQRHGLLRAYAAKAKGGLEERAHGRRDLFLLWSLVALTAALVMRFRQDTFWGQAAKAWKKIAMPTPALDALVAVTVTLVLIALVLWARHEKKLSAPRLIFLSSTVALLTIVVLGGPIVGFLVFSLGHSLEYILFVHLVAKRRASPPWGIRALGPDKIIIVSAALLLAFVLAREVWTVTAFVIYYSSTSILHYVYDGMIWKMRRPEVRASIA